MKLSIIIPVYNVETYIAQCLESVFNQDIPESDYEVICVNDASPDNSRDIVLEFQQKHQNLLLMEHDVNKRLGAARNTGLKYAKGEYVWFVDSDDRIQTNCLKQLVEIMKANQLDVLHFDHFCNENPIKSSIQKDTLLSGANMFFSSNVRWSDEFIVVWRHIYRRAFLEEYEIRFAEGVMCEDNDYAFLVYIHAQRVMHIAELPYLYQGNPDSFGGQNKQNPALFLYYLDCAYRLVRIYDSLSLYKADKRFKPALEQFIRYFVERCYNLYLSFMRDKRRECAGIAKRYKLSVLTNWMSKKKYVYFRLKLLVTCV